MFLSQLKKGDLFKFLPEQKTYYLMNGKGTGGGDSVVEYTTNGFTVFEVLKQNRLSAKCKPADGYVEYHFKYAGPCMNDTIKCQDVQVVKVEPNELIDPKET